MTRTMCLVGVWAAWLAGAPTLAVAADSDPSGSLVSGLAGMEIVHPQTGSVTFGVSLGYVAGPARSSVELVVGFSQHRVFDDDRSGLGRGWGLGWRFVDVDAGQLVLEDGRELRIDSSAASGLRDYRLGDIAFSPVYTFTPGGVEYPAGRPAAYRLENLRDGMVEYFDAVGDLLARVDRFGHVFEFTYRVVADKHQLQRITGPFGNQLAIAWGASEVVVSTPERSDQKEPSRTVIARSGGRVSSIRDPVGRQTRIEWTVAQDGSALLPLLDAVISPTGARTELSYRQYPASSGGVWAVDRIEVVAAATGEPLAEPVDVQLDPVRDGHNFTGCPSHCAVGGRDVLAESGSEYTYTTRFSTPTVQVSRTYSALHQLVEETRTAKVDGAWREVQQIRHAYEQGASTKLRNAPATYQLPTDTDVVAIDPDDPQRRREVQVSVAYDRLGREIRRVTADTETRISYGRYSVPVREESIDRKTGERTVVDHTPTVDQTAIARSQTTVVPAGRDSRVVSVTEYEYQDDQRLSGEVTKTTVTGEAKAAGGDPGPATTTTRTDLNVTSGVRTDTVIGADGVEAVTTTDLASGLMLSSRVANQAAETISYDAAGRQVTETAPDGTVTVTEYEHNATGAITTTRRQADGYATRSHADELGRETRTQDNLRPSTGALLSEAEWHNLSTKRYDVRGRLVGETDTAGRETTITYDALGRPKTVTDPAGARAISSYDDVAGTTSSALVSADETSPIQTTTEARDPDARVIETTSHFADGTSPVTTTTQYGSFGRPVTRTGSDPVRIEHEYSPAGSPSRDIATSANEATEPVEAHYERDALGNLAAKTLSSGARDAHGVTRTFDPAGRVTEWANATGEETEISYDAAGRIERTVGPDGIASHQRFDDAGRLVESWTHGREGTREHIKRSYDPITGRPASIWRVGQEADSEITYRYLADGSIRSITYPGEQTVSYTYTDDGQLASISDPTRATTHYEYEADSGRLRAAIQSREGQRLAAVFYRYDGLGRLARVSRHLDPDTGASGGVLSRYEHDGAGRLTSESHTGAGGAVLEQHHYQYTPDGALLTDVAQVDGAATVTEHTYDPHGCLTRSVITAGDSPGSDAVIGERRYSLDLASNITGVIDAASERAYAYDAANRVSAITTRDQTLEPDYDAEGRLTRGPEGERYRYDTLGRLIESVAPGGQRVEYTYWSSGQRATQTTTMPGGDRHTVRFFYDHAGTVLAEQSPDGGSASYLLAADREARTLTLARGTQTTYYTTTRRGDKSTTHSPSGQVRTRTRFTDYGVPSRTSGDGQPVPINTGHIADDPYGYTGAAHRPNGLIELGSRDLDPNLQAFTTPDTPAAGMFNLYAYATGDPINQIDPTGMAPEWLTLDNAMAVGGLVMSGIGTGHAVAALLNPAAGPIAVTVAGVALLGAAADIALSGALTLDHLGAIRMSSDVRQRLQVATLVTGAVDLGTGIASGAIAAYRAQLKIVQRQAVGTTLARMIGDSESIRPNPHRAIELMRIRRTDPLFVPRNPDYHQHVSLNDGNWMRQYDPVNSTHRMIKGTVEGIMEARVATATTDDLLSAGQISLDEARSRRFLHRFRIERHTTRGQRAVRELPGNGSTNYTLSVFVERIRDKRSKVLFTDRDLVPYGNWFSYRLRSVPEA